MRMRLALFAAAVLLPVGAFGQSVPLTGTVTDTPDNQTWNNGIITFTFFGPQGGSYRWTGGTLNPNNPITATLSATGTYSVSVPDNSQITPVDSSWTVTVCPAVLPATSGCFKSNKIITAANTVLNLTPPSPRFTVPLTPQSIAPISAYADSEILGGWVGFGYFNLSGSTPTQRVCTVVSATGCTTFVAAGVPFSSGLIDVTNPATFGGTTAAKFDGKACFGNVNTVTVTNASNQITCNVANFTGLDAGKQFTASNGCCGVNFNFSGTALFPFVGMHICRPTDSGSGGVGVVNSTTANICKDADGTAANATSNCSGATCIVAWATNDDTAFSQAEVAWSSGNKCRAIQLPAGINALLQPHFTSPGANCLAMEPQADYTAAINGQGQGATVLGLFSGFNFPGCTANGGVCFGGYLEANWKDFQFNGFGIGNTGAASAKTIIGANLGSQFFQVACIAFGGSDTNLTGIALVSAARGWGVISDGCGNIGATATGVALGAVQCHYCFFGDTKGPNFEPIGGPVYCYGCEYGGTGGTVLVEPGGSNSDFHQIGGSVWACSNTNESAILTSDNNAATITLIDVTITCTGTGSNALFGSTNDTVFLVRSSLGGVARNIGAGTVLAGLYMDDASRLTGAGTNPTPTCVFTSGGGTGPTCALGAGSRNEQGYIIGTTGTTPSSTGTITLTFYGTSFLGLNGGARACHWTIDNSGTAWGNGAVAQTNTQSTTIPVVAWSNLVSGTLTNLTASVPYRIDYRC